MKLPSSPYSVPWRDQLKLAQYLKTIKLIEASKCSFTDSSYVRHTGLIPFKQIPALPARQIQNFQISLRNEFSNQHGFRPIIKVS